MDKSDFELLKEAFNKFADSCRPRLERIYKSTPEDAVKLIKKAAEDLLAPPVVKNTPPKPLPRKKGRNFKL